MTSILAAWVGLLLGVAGGPVTNVSIVPASDRTDIVISVDGEIQYRDFTMEGPARLVVDLMGAQHALGQENFRGVNRGGVVAVRTSQYSPEVVRIVLELDQVVGYQVMAGNGFVRVSMERSGEAFEPWSATGATSTMPAAPVMPAAVPTPAPEPESFSVQQAAPRITVSFTATPIRDVLFTFAEFAGRSIVPGSNVTGVVSADIRDQPWDQALQVILESQGLAARELENGIIRVDNLENLTQREAVEQLTTRPFRINFATAAELEEPIRGLLSERGSVSVGQATNTVIVQDIPRVLQSVQDLIRELDVRTPQITIAAKIIFVNRTDLNELGVLYDLKDSQGNQLNLVTPGGIDQDGDGIIEPPDEQVDVGTDVISLGGNSVAALGNARARVASPSISLLTSLILGRHTLISFLEALQSVNLSDIQASPQVSVLDNQTARIQVGERTPIRVIDASGGGAGGGGGGGGGGQQAIIPTATVQIEETGIILEVTPHVTGGDNVLLELHAERSAAQIAESDIGLIFTTQEANSRVLVKDGETVVIGGLTVTEKSETRSGIPLLMDIPILGRLFRVNREQTVQRDLMILVTPYINRN